MCYALFWDKIFAEYNIFDYLCHQKSNYGFAEHDINRIKNS